MFCPNCKNQIKVNRFCTRCGLNLTILRYQDVKGEITNRLSWPSAMATGVTQNPGFASKQFAVAQTAQLTPRITMPERENFQADTAAAAFAPKQVNRLVPAILLVVVMLVLSGTALLWRFNRPTSVQAQAITPGIVEVATGDTTNRVVESQPVILPDSVWTVIESQTRYVADAQQALIADQQMAVIEPGGQLALTMKDDQFFGNGAAADLQIRGAAQQGAAYRVFVRHSENNVWQRIDFVRLQFSGFAQHDMGHHGIQQGRQVLILNDGLCPLQIDSVEAVYPNLVVEHAAHHAH